MKREVVLLFSGGRDSSLACFKLARKKFLIHLLTFDNGAMIKIDLSRYRIKELENLFPNQIHTNKIIPIHGLFKKLALSNIEQDFKKYKTNLICMGCKLAMHTGAVIYCIENKIKYLADGYVKYQCQWPEQMPEAIHIVRLFHHKFGIEYANPIYDYNSKSKVTNELYQIGMSTKSLEGSCLFGGTFSTPSPKIVTSYIKEKLPLCEEYIKKHFEDVKKPLSHDDLKL